MEFRRNRVTTSGRTEGGLLPADLLAKIAAGDRDVPGLADADFGLRQGERAREAITKSWNRLVGAWAALETVRVGAEADAALTGATRERFLLPLFEELGFGRVAVARPVEIEGTTYPISHSWADRVPIHLVGFEVPLDARTKGVRGAAGAAPHALVQEYLNRTDLTLWGLVSNGRILRLLRDSTSLTRQAYVEFDLEAIFEGELFADFALLWSVLQRTRFDGERPADCLLEQWTKKAADDGTRALDKLRGGVEHAIETLGAGFLAHPANGELREALRTGGIDRQDYYRELLRLVYRLIFVFAAEDRRDDETGREILLDPAAPEDAVARYRRFYSSARLRVLAGRRRGTRHPDLWVTQRRVFAALGGGGAASIALPDLGSFLFGPSACPHLDGAELRNEDLLDAVRALATIEEDRRLRLVDYRNLGAEELGGVYEGLLELHPRIELDANPPRFALGTAAGNERKSTGSYYTPTSLISSLIDTALEPVVDEAVRGKTGAQAETALLSLAVVDPAAGSGHFLVAAAHRLAKRLATIRTGEGEPSPAAMRHSLRDVIAHCIHAVDINPMAVELCKVSLWLEALEPGRPLTFLDAHIRRGNSLLGTTVELAAAGIPDRAFEPIAGDEKPIAAAWRKRNAQERSGQQALFEATLEIPTHALAAAARKLDALPDDSPAAVAAKGAQFATFLGSPDAVRSRAALDAWCAAFVAPKVKGAPEITTSIVRAMAVDPSRAPVAVRSAVDGLAAEYAFFHWQIEFPAVFERGGFDVVLGNPPWERVKLAEKEFFAERSPAIAAARRASERKSLITSLPHTDPDLWDAYLAALRRAEAEALLLRASGRYPRGGRGDINTYAVFVEAMRAACGPRGRLGVIVPTGIATDDTTKYLFGDLVSTGSLASLYSFENEEFIFRDVHHATKFCLLTITGDGLAPTADLVFFARQVSDLEQLERHFQLTPDEFELLNPNTRTCPTFRSHEDSELAKSIYRRVPIFVDERNPSDGNPWGVSFMTMFHMTNDSALFRDSPAENRLPLYEAKMIHQFDHRYGTYDGQTQEQANQGVLPQVPDQAKVNPSYAPTPRYWVDEVEVARRLEGRHGTDWYIGWRDITSSVSSRTVVASILPRAALGNKVPVALSSDVRLPFLVANLNAIALDWPARQKIGGITLNFFILKQLPMLPPTAYDAPITWGDVTFGDWLRKYLVELVYTSSDMAGFALDLGWQGPPYVWNAARRKRLRAEVDAAFLLLYGYAREQVAHVLDSFWVVRDNDLRDAGEFLTKSLVLEAYDALSNASASRPWQSQLDPRPGDPRAAHPPRPGEPPGEWRDPAEASPAVRPVATTERRPLATPPAAPSVSPAAEPQASDVARPSATQQVPLSVATEGNGWRPEATVDPRALTLGAHVRHRAFGNGVVLGVEGGAKTTQLLIRFDRAGEKWIQFGFGLLEFKP